MGMKRPLFKFFVLTYLVFWGMLGLIGLVFSLGVPDWVRYILPVIFAWSPTIVFLLIYDKKNALTAEKKRQQAI